MHRQILIIFGSVLILANKFLLARWSFLSKTGLSVFSHTQVDHSNYKKLKPWIPEIFRTGFVYFLPIWQRLVSRKIVNQFVFNRFDGFLYHKISAAFFGYFVTEIVDLLVSLVTFSYSCLSILVTLKFHSCLHISVCRRETHVVRHSFTVCSPRDTDYYIGDRWLFGKRRDPRNQINKGVNVKVRVSA